MPTSRARPVRRPEPFLLLWRFFTYDESAKIELILADTIAPLSRRFSARRWRTRVAIFMLWLIHVVCRDMCHWAIVWGVIILILKTLWVSLRWHPFSTHVSTRPARTVGGWYLAAHYEWKRADWCEQALFTEKTCPHILGCFTVRN